MKILFDHGTPAPLRGYFPEHTVNTAAEKGWAELSNGELLDQAESGEYGLLITTEQSVRYQQRRNSNSFSRELRSGSQSPGSFATADRCRTAPVWVLQPSHGHRLCILTLHCNLSIF